MISFGPDLWDPIIDEQRKRLSNPEYDRLSAIHSEFRYSGWVSALELDGESIFTIVIIHDIAAFVELVVRGQA